jgi:hypothetical protein
MIAEKSRAIRGQHRVSDVSTISWTSCDPEDWTAVPVPPAKPVTGVTRVRSNAKTTSSCKAHHKARLDNVIKNVVKMLETSDMIAKVDIVDGCLTIQVHGAVDPVMQEVSTLAQKILLEVTSQSKCIYALGFATPKVFRKHADGFEVTLGAMESAARACWHVFKKGACRHGASCCNQHPVLTVPVRVVIEAVDMPVN